MKRSAVATTIAIALMTTGTARAQSLQSPPRTLSILTAKKASKTAVDTEVSLDRPTYRASCKRRSRLSVKCRARWEPAATSRKRRGTITVTRTGTFGSPTDSYKLVVSGRSRRGTLLTPTRRANLGNPLLLVADLDKTRVRIVVGRPIDNLPSSEFFGPAPGTRFVGYPISYANVGARTFTTFPENDSVLVLSDGSTLEPVIAPGTPSCGQSDELIVPPGQQRISCVVFQLPFNVAPGVFEMNLDSRNSAETGQWL